MKCKNCGKEIEAKNRISYCSEICRREYERITRNKLREITTTRRIPIVSVPCTQCGKEFYMTYKKYEAYVDLCINTNNEEPRLCPKCGARVPLDHEAKSYIAKEINLDIDLYGVRRRKHIAYDLYIPPQIIYVDDAPPSLFNKKLFGGYRPVSVAQKKEELRLAWN